MALYLQTIVDNEKILRTKCENVEKIDKTTIDKMDDMFNIIYKYNGIGLAGNQAGLKERLVVVDLQDKGVKHPIYLINPVIIEHSEELVDSEEGSLSIPGEKGVIKRFKTITVKYFDKNGKEQILKADGLLSICIQHEIDGLDGKLYIDYLPDDKKQEILDTIDAIKIKKEVKIITRDDDVLRAKAKKIEKIDQEIIDLGNHMLDVMYKDRGIGLAGNQIGVLKRIVVIDLQENKVKKPLILINPEIIEKSKEMVEGPEGCLSVPEENHNVKRHERVKVKYTNIEGKEVIVEADGLFAICLQHEIDHLDGKLYIDYLSKLKRDLILDRIRKRLKNKEE